MAASFQRPAVNPKAGGGRSRRLYRYARQQLLSWVEFSGRLGAEIRERQLAAGKLGPDQVVLDARNQL